VGFFSSQEKQHKEKWGTSQSLAWRVWWDRIEPDLTATQWSALWDLFDRLRFYKVVTPDEESGPDE
jgi:hypothetical protein